MVPHYSFNCSTLRLQTFMTLKNIEFWERKKTVTIIGTWVHLRYMINHINNNYLFNCNFHYLLNFLLFNLTNLDGRYNFFSQLVNK